MTPPYEVTKRALEGYELRRAGSASEWDAYHRIRRSVLYDARGLFNTYDECHPDDRKAFNQPMLLLLHGTPVAAFRLDLDSSGLGIIRSMAVEQSLQRRGHGRAAILLLIELAINMELHTLEVNSAPDAVLFYRRLGFDLIDADREAPLLQFELKGF